MSLSHRDLRETLQRELRNAGIKSEIERTGSGHMQLNWEVNGKRDFLLTSWTPSDNRVALNARALLRRKLRAAGVLEKAIEPLKTVLGKALSLPMPTEPFAERIAKLEEDVTTLLDMFAELSAGGVVTREKLHETAAIVAAVAPPEVLPAEPTPPSLPIPKTRYRPPSKVHDLLLCVDYDWTPFAEIARREGKRTRGALSVALDNLKKKGLVENGGRDRGWRKVRQTEQEIAALTAEMTPAPAPTPPRVPAPKAPQIALLDVMGFNWMSKGEIELRSQLRGSQLSSALSMQKRAGNIENGLRGMWRKKRHQFGAVSQPPAVKPPAPATQRSYWPTGKTAALLHLLSFECLPLDEIIRRDGRSPVCVSSNLTYLKKMGLIENPAHKMWRRCRPHDVAAMNGHHQAALHSAQ